MKGERYHHLIADGSDGYPPLLVIFSRRLPEHVLANFKSDLSAAMAAQNHILLFEDGQNMDIYQLVNGRWMSLDSTIELEGAPMPEVKKVNFKEFL